MTIDERYMRRALDLAALGAGRVSPNPLVGCVIVHQDKIIGEGWHAYYGGPHAEVAAIQSVSEENKSVLSQATLYVTLEPCNHYGKTPPCVDLILRHGISQTVIAATDNTPLASGGAQRLRAAGLSVTVGVLAQEARALNRRFFTYMEKQRPYIILKWAQSHNGFIASANGQYLAISNAHSRQLVHKMRAEEDAILIGRKTALYDNPRLNVHYWHGKNPTRILVGTRPSLPAHLHLFDGSQPTLAYYSSDEPPPIVPQVSYVPLPKADFIPSLLRNLHARNISSVIVEGGRTILCAFLQGQAWDIAYVITSDGLIENGIAAPEPQGKRIGEEYIGNDLWTVFENPLEK